MIVIKHVKWCKNHESGEIIPCADTDQFGKLLKQNRGTLIFIPDETDSPAKRDEYSDQKLSPEMEKMFLENFWNLLA